MDRKTKKELIRTKSEQLGSLQTKLKENKLPVLVLVEGWGTAGKGSRIASMIHDLDPRFFQVISVSSPTPEELAKGAKIPLPVAERVLHKLNF